MVKEPDHHRLDDMNFIVLPTNAFVFSFTIENQFIMKYLIGSFLLLLSFNSCQSTKENLDDNKPPVTIDGRTIEGLQLGAVDIFRQFVHSSPEDDNVIISPLSIQYAFGMAANGASGSTLDEIMRLVRAPASDLQQVNTALKDIMHNIAADDKDYTVSVSNGVFYDPNKFRFNGTYEKSLLDQYNAELLQSDFDDRGATVKAVNKWASDHTRQRIQKVLDDVNEGEFMFLLNALYMKASWDKGFAAELTAKQNFTTSKSLQNQVDMMTRHEPAILHRSDDEVAVVIPMGNGRLEALFILPKHEGITAYIDQLSRDKIEKLYGKGEVTDMYLKLPKTELLLHYDLKRVLVDMGIVLPFSSTADFTKMGSASGRINLSRAMHDVFMKMDEKGMEGAAVTTIGVETTSAPSAEEVSFDRPFVMIVRDKDSGNYLFMGKIENPDKH